MPFSVDAMFTSNRRPVRATLRLTARRSFTLNQAFAAAHPRQRATP